MRKPTTFTPLILITLFFVGSVNAQITSQSVDKLVEEAIKRFDVAGASVGIVKDGKVIHAKGYGVKSVETGEKVDEHTPFAIGSNTKAFTTAALAILVDDGKLSWHDKVIDHLPEFKMYNAYVTENFNIEDLLTHRSGLGLGVGDLMFFPDGSNFTIKDVVSSFQYFEPQSAFRTKFDYDNLLYLVAGEVIARSSGETWEEFVQTRIIEPLEMKNSYSSLAQIEDREIAATPHSSETGPLKAISHFEQNCDNINGAAGAIYSSASDICRWMLVHLNHGKYGDGLDKQLFSKTRQGEMWTIHTSLPLIPIPRYRNHFSGYGLGWRLADMNGNLVVSHTGGVPGMLSKTIMVPDLDLGIVVLTNTSLGGGAVFETVSRTIQDSYMGLEDFGWMEKIATIQSRQQTKGDQVTEDVWKTVEAANDDHLDPNDYIGIYQDRWFGKVEVYPKADQLWFKSLRSPKLVGQMHFYKANSFAIKWDYRDMNADAFAIFSLDEEGKAQSIKMKGISPNIDFSFDFQDLDLKRLPN